MTSITRADDDRGAEGDDQPGPGVVLEGPAAEAADEERVERPDDGGDRGRGDEAPARVAGEAAGEGHRGAAAGDEPADDDELRAEPVERPLRPRAASARPSAWRRTCAARRDRSGGRAGSRGCRRGRRPRPRRPTSSAMRGSVLPAVATPRAMTARLARQRRGRSRRAPGGEGDQVGDDRVDLKAGERAHRRAAGTRPCQCPSGPRRRTASEHRAQYRDSGAATSSDPGIGHRTARTARRSRPPPGRARPRCRPAAGARRRRGGAAGEPAVRAAIGAVATADVIRQGQLRDLLQPVPPPRLEDGPPARARSATCSSRRMPLPVLGLVVLPPAR